MAAVVADTSPLIALHQIGHLHLLERLFGEVLVPPAVAREAAPSLPEPPAWIRTVAPTQPIGSEVLRASLGPGESEALSLALELRADVVVLDDRQARRLASGLGLSPRARMEVTSWAPIVVLIQEHVITCYACFREGVEPTKRHPGPAPGALEGGQGRGCPTRHLVVGPDGRRVAARGSRRRKLRTGPAPHQASSATGVRPRNPRRTPA